MKNNLATGFDLEGDAIAHRNNNEEDPEATRWRASSEQLYREALDAMPNNPKWRQNLANNLTKRGRFTEALDELEIVWRYRNDLPPGQTLNVTELPMTMGLVAMNLHQDERAAHWLEVALDQDLDPRVVAVVRQKLAEVRQRMGVPATGPVAPE